MIEATRWLEIIVADNGTGMSEHTRKQIFEPFFTTKDVGSGSGLGLPLVQKLVHEFNGEILVDSELGEGTVFTMYLPVVVNQNEQGQDNLPPQLINRWLTTTNTKQRDKSDE